MRITIFENKWSQTFGNNRSSIFKNIQGIYLYVFYAYKLMFYREILLHMILNLCNL